MKILLHNQAQSALENFRIEDNSGGVYYDGQGLFVWFKMVDGVYDCGVCFSFEEAFNKLKHG